MKVLVSAYACEPNCGSEPAIGWNIVEGLSGRHDLTVMTRKNNRQVILECDETWVRKVDWVFLDPPRWLTFWKRGRSGVKLFYLIWQAMAYFKGRKLHRERSFDLVHHLTFASIYPASPFAFLGIPFVAGPLGGALEPPPALIESLEGRIRLAVWRQKLGRKLGEWVSLAGAAYRRCSFAIGATEEAVKRLETLGARKVRLEVQSGLSSEDLATLSARPRPDRDVGEPLRVFVASRMIVWKGVDLAIEAIAKARSRGIQMTVEISETGPEEQRIRALVKRLSLEDSVTFLGRLPSHESLLEKLACADVLLHPAFSESFGQVCLESLASGLPVICLKWGGPGVLVGEDCGYPVDPGTRDEVIERLGGALVRCLEDRNQGLPAVETLHKRAAVFQWQGLVDAVDEAYASSLCEG